MCTVSFVPTLSGVIITSNRDENKLRSALPPIIVKSGNNTLVYPKDPKSSGTWIAIKNTGEAAVLLNGAFENHNKKSNYINSRGKIILEILKSENPSNAFDELRLADIENFTLILYLINKLITYRWDGVNKHQEKLDIKKPHIWSSATLYTKQISIEREKWFSTWLKNEQQINQETIINFHKTAGKDDKENGLVIKRSNNIETVSITSIFVNSEKIALFHEDLGTKQITNINLPI